MAVKYLVGIDFGHGETTASCYEIAKGEDKVAVTHLKITDSTDANEFKKKSVVYQIYQEDNSYSYQLDPDSETGGAIHISFKDNVCELDKNREKKEAFQNFIRLIYEEIIKNNSFLTEKDNEFLLYIACPTKWDENDKKDYKEFVEEAIKRPIEWVINESDAAYFKEKKDGLVLVVDFGSSTIDYTLMNNNQKINIDHLSNRLGARHIECDLLKYYKYDHNSNYKMRKEKSEIIKLKSGNPHLDIDTALKLELREHKESAYSKGYRFLNFQAYIEHTYMWRIIQDIPEVLDILEILEQEGDLAYQKNFRDFEKECINNYIKEVIGNFRIVKKEVYKRCQEQNLDPAKLQIILSGGASIMPWVRTSLQDIFGTTVKKDSLPEYIVSDGIVKYAYALWNVKTKLLEVEHEFDEWANENLKNIFENAVSEVCSKIELKELQAEKSNAATWVFNHPFTAKEPNYSVKDFIDMMKKHNETIANKKKSGINNQIKDAIQPQLNKKICSSFNKKLANLLGMTMKIENLNLFPVEINLLPETFSIAEDEQTTIDRCTDALKKCWFGPELLWWGTNPTKPREQSERITMMEFYAESLTWKKYADLIFNNIDNYVLRIKESVKKALIPIVADALTFNPCGYDLEKELSLKSYGNTTSNNFTSSIIENVFSTKVTYVSQMGADTVVEGEIKLGEVAKGDTLFIGYDNPQMVHVKDILDNEKRVGGIVRMILDCGYTIIKVGATIHSKTFKK